MNESWDRWQARIGSLKPAALLILVFVVIGLCFSGGAAFSAFNNVDGPVSVTVAQLVDGAVDAGKHVNVSGYATLFDAYTLESDGKQEATYFFLLDRDGGYAVVVKAKTATTYGRQPSEITFSGMTRSIPSDLRKLVESDIPEIKESGFRTTTKLYVHEEAKPPNLYGSLLMLLILGVIAALCLLTVPFPSTVFAAAPLPAPVPAELPQRRLPIKASGRFLRLKSVRPLEVGKGSRKFSNGVANLVPLGEHNLMVYIHHIMRTKTYGITVNTTTTDWGVFISGENVEAIEAGKLYGWKDRSALRFTYQGDQGKQETLYLSFDDPETQADAVGILEKVGFVVPR